MLQRPPLSPQGGKKPRLGAATAAAAAATRLRRATTAATPARRESDIAESELLSLLDPPPPPPEAQSPGAALQQILDETAPKSRPAPAPPSLRRTIAHPPVPQPPPPSPASSTALAGRRRTPTEQPPPQDMPLSPRRGKPPPRRLQEPAAEARSTLRITGAVSIGVLAILLVILCAPEDSPSGVQPKLPGDDGTPHTRPASRLRAADFRAKTVVDMVRVEAIHELDVGRADDGRGRYWRTPRVFTVLEVGIDRKEIGRSGPWKEVATRILKPGSRADAAGHVLPRTAVGLSGAVVVAPAYVSVWIQRAGGDQEPARFVGRTYVLPAGAKACDASGTIQPWLVGPDGARIVGWLDLALEPIGGCGGAY